MTRSFQHLRGIAGTSITKALAIHARVPMCSCRCRWVKQSSHTGSPI